MSNQFYLDKLYPLQDKVMPKVSVIVPNYNHAKFLKQRIDSILNQTYQDFELILLDDCSPDNSVEILNEYADHSKVKHLVLNETNSGSTFKQWEKGLSLAQGEFIWIAESDDYSELNFLEEMMREIESDNSIVVAFCATTACYEDNSLSPIEYEELAFIANKKLVGTDFIKKCLADRNRILNTSSVVFRKQSAINHISHARSYRYAGDLALWIDMLSGGGSVYHCGQHLNYFKTNLSFSNRFGKYFMSLKEGYTLFVNQIGPLFSEKEASDYKTYLNIWHGQILKAQWSGWPMKYDLKMLLFLITFDLALLKKYIICMVLKRMKR